MERLESAKRLQSGQADCKAAKQLYGLIQRMQTREKRLSYYPSEQSCEPIRNH